MKSYSLSIPSHVTLSQALETAFVIAALFLFLLPSPLAAQGEYVPLPGDLHVFEADDNQSHRFFVCSVVGALDNGSDTLILERAGTSGTFLSHSAAATVDNRGMLVELEGLRFDPTSNDLYPLREPSEDTLTIWGERYGGSMAATVDRRFDTTLYGQSVRAFTISTSLYSATIAEQFGLVIMEEAGVTLRLSSAVIGGVSYNRNSISRDYLPLCVGNMARYDGAKTSMPPRPNDGPYGVVHRIVRDTTIMGTQYYIRESSKGGRDILRSSAEGVYVRALPGQDELLIDSRASIGSHIGPGMLGSARIVVDTGTVLREGAERHVLTARVPFEQRGVIADGTFWAEEEWMEGLGMTKYSDESHVPIVNPPEWEWNDLELSFYESCGAAGGTRATYLPEVGDIHVYHAETEDTSGVLITHAMHAGDMFSPNSDTLLLYRAGLGGIDHHQWSALVTVNAAGLITELFPEMPGSFTEYQLYPAREPVDDDFLVNYPLNPALMAFHVIRRFDTTLCGASVRAYTFEDDNPVYPVSMTMADGIGLIHASFPSTEITLTSSVIGGVPCNRESTLRNFMPLCLDNMYQYEGFQTTTPTDPNDGPTQKTWRIPRDTLIDGETWFVRTDQDGATRDYLRNDGGSLFLRLPTMTQSFLQIPSAASLGDRVMTTNFDQLFIVDTSLTDIEGELRRKVTAFPAFWVHGSLINVDDVLITRESWIDGIGMEEHYHLHTNVPRGERYETYDQLSAYTVCGSSSDVPEFPLAPSAFRIRSLYPNPFRSAVSLDYEVMEKEALQLRILDVLGRQVLSMRLPDQPLGLHSWIWDGRDERGLLAPAGLYRVMLICTQDSQVRNVLLLR